MAYESYIRFECNERDKQDLAQIAAHRYGGASMSATLRLMIRREAEKLGITQPTVNTSPTAVQESAG